MSWDLLQRFLESDVFNSNPFLPVSYLSRYADHVGIHYVLCNKLRQFPYEDIEFFLPQLCHLIISVDNESMALEEFLLDLCEESVTAALLTFWLFQTYLHDLASNPQTSAFQTCRRVYNKVQHIIFGLADTARQDKIKENVLPVTVLSSFVLASVALPMIPRWAGPLAVAQARRPQPEADLTINTADRDDGPKLPPPQRAHTINTVSSKSKRSKERKASAATIAGTAPGRGAEAVGGALTSSSSSSHQRPGSSRGSASPPSAAAPSPPSSTVRRPKISTDPSSKRPSALAIALQSSHEARMSTASLPLPSPRTPSRATPPLSAGAHPGDSLRRRHSHHAKVILSSTDLTMEQRVGYLRQHYFRSQTQFLTALEGISNRLVIVPKPARMSALRAELALISQDLPAEVDIPIICPPTLVEGSPGRSCHHRIVRLNPAESTVLNSAEKVPYLMMVEVLRDDFTFDPQTPDNRRLLATLITQGGTSRRLFDLSSETPRVNQTAPATPEPIIDSVFEPVSGDLGSSPLLKPDDDDEMLSSQQKYASSSSTRPAPPYGIPRMPSGLMSASTTALDPPTPRSSGQSISRSSSPGGRRMTLNHGRPSGSIPSAAVSASSVAAATTTTAAAAAAAAVAGADQPDFSALATHMRTASQMLAQLDATSGKRPKQEVAAIRSKIIASMQSLEEKSFDTDDHGPTFDTIMAKSAVASDNNGGGGIDNDSTNPDLEDEAQIDKALDANNINASAGRERMENDFKTGGVQRRGDRDDPSAAVFGEAWEAKKERIRKSSPYGWMKNWDLVSVIVKTGSDLRQEAFACQLIRVCHRIWTDASVDVWVKQMRILVTGESSGLIETITNGVSLHSLKRSLTLALVESGQNPRHRIATLRDHFLKAFGQPDSEPFRAGVEAFKRSLAAYSIISYVLQLKDRHNGNVLIDSEGHIIHIDFGFMLSNSPGSVGFEAAPFKLTHEYVDVLGGLGSPDFEDYKRLCKQAFQDNIIDLVSMMGRDSQMPCFAAGVVQTTNALRQRFQLHLSAEEAEHFVDTDLVAKSFGSYYTRLYDTFQYRTQGIY
ncbi:phosphatidylinositol 4-kinase B [Geosmithia morbida]|uniref:1-phosphatidylinositol 4-kinase n=1 Tax=Geosmithia morbida TaxID=1094350 RepID=A0A9P4YWK0_9HYPO|nr:phosphatidylinositol 4-kinase B [Geosmithia morbida]KAF4123112.1 phosphatidylinositol 4-kinase B [Geosmithia morbida]